MSFKKGFVKITSIGSLFTIISKVTLHTGEQSVLWPWCYTPDRPADSAFMEKVGNEMIKAYMATRNGASFFALFIYYQRSYFYIFTVYFYLPGSVVDFIP